MRVAITGANGFLGKYLIKACLKAGYEVLALVRKNADIPEFAEHPKFNLCKVDYKLIDRDLETLKSNHGVVDFFIHNAGKNASIHKNDYKEINTNLTGRLVEALSETGFLNGKLIYVSSYTAHGPMNVNHPVSHYGHSKKGAEEHIVKSKYPTLIFRPTAIYGPGDYAFLPLFKGAKNGLYAYTKSNQKMTLIHGEDMASAVLLDMEAKQGVIYVSDGDTYTHDQFVKTLSEILGKRVRKIKVPVFISKLLLGLSDIWNRIINGSPKLTLEKFEEITQDWDLHSNQELPHSKVKIKYDLRKGFEETYKYYSQNKLL